MRRATFILYEEARQLKKTMIDSVFEKMAHPRQAKYLLYEGSPYAKNSRWAEDCQTVYITSAGYCFEWFWRVFKQCFTDYFKQSKIKYNIFAGDIFMSIDAQLKTVNDYKKAKRMSSDMSFRIEDLNEMVRESADAFFTIESFKKNQDIETNWKPPTDLDIIVGNDMGNKPKEDTEIRLVIVDFAFANTTSKQENDNTIIECMSLHWKKNRFERHMDYIEGYPASDSLGAADRVREIFWDYKADYIVMDGRNGGETLYNRMTMSYDHPNRGALWDSRGLGICDEKDLQVVPEAKLVDLANRVVDKNAVPCIIFMTGTSELNSLMWQELKKQLETNNIHTLIDTQKYQDKLEDTGEYYQMTADQLADVLLPYAQNEMLIKEATELQAEIKDGKIKLVEPRSSTKDRAVCLSYGNYIASKIENKWLKTMIVEEVNIDDIQLVW